EGLAAAGAVADDSDLAVSARQRAQVVRRAADVADQPLVRHAALRPCRPRRAVRVSTGSIAETEVRHQRRTAVRCELPRYLLRAGVVGGHRVEDHHTAKLRGPERPGEVGRDLVPAVAGDADGLSAERLVHSCAPCGDWHGLWSAGLILPVLRTA